MDEIDTCIIVYLHRVIFGKLKDRVTWLDKNIWKLSSLVKQAANKYTTRNQVQIFTVIKCIEASEVISTTHCTRSPAIKSGVSI